MRLKGPAILLVDELEYNATGNEGRLVKYFAGRT
jgi:hypothetical protein